MTTATPSSPSSSAFAGLPLDPQDAVDATANPPGQPVLRRQTASHALALARMRERLADPGHDLALRSLARSSTDDPTVALLDAWAVVADTVSFYSERIAHEGFLRTAAHRGSVRELARTLGYELRPGVAAQVDLSFTAETAAGSPDVVVVPSGTPVQSVPGPGELPQTFETVADLEVRAAWNQIAAVDARPQTIASKEAFVWVRGPVTARAGDAVLVSYREPLIGTVERPAILVTRRLRTLTDIVPDADGHPGWTRLELDSPIVPETDPRALFPHTDVEVHLFRERLRLFGWSAPDPNRLVVDGAEPYGSEHEDPSDTTTKLVWEGFAVSDPIEVDGEHPAIAPDSWVVLAQQDVASVHQVVSVQPDGRSAYAVSGPVTLVGLAGSPDLSDVISRRKAVVHAGSIALPATQEPDDDPLDGTELVLEPRDPLLPPGRRLLLSGTDTATGTPTTVPVEVVDCALSDHDTMTVTVADPLPPLRRQGLVVLGNVATAGHGETVQQVLGSGDGRARFSTFRPRRPPLTYVRVTTPEGARAEIDVRVDGVLWEQVESLLDAGPGDRVYVLRHEEGGDTRIVLGDGVHGARPATGVENVTATYRVGIGEVGEVAARSVSLLVRRPLGIREVTNPVQAQDWAPAETLEEARTNAPLRVRTLDRAVSVADHEDFARGYAGVGPARADLVWDGRVHRVLVTVLGAQASEPSTQLVEDLHEALDLARDPGAPLDVLAGERIWFGVRVEVAHDPAYERATVVDAVIAALQATFGAAARAFARPVTSAGVLLTVRSVQGVTACTVPRLFPLATVPAPPAVPSLPDDEDAVDVVPASEGRYEDGALRAAQLLGIADGGVQIGEMTT